MTEHWFSYLPLSRWWLDVIDILLVAFLLYRVMLLLRGTRAVQMAAGLAVIIVVYFAAKALELYTLHWLLGTVLSSLFLLIIIVFQDDIRRVLTQMGQTPFLKTRVKTFQAMEEVAKAASTLAETKTGALMVLEREIGLGDYLESGVPVDGRVTRELLCTIFHPGTPLHDGAVIIRDGRLAGAGCVLPLTTNPDVSKRLGTRHRAAIGVTEHTDAVAVVVSEETGSISVAIAGKITRGIDSGTLRRILHNTFSLEEEERPWWKRRLI
ncbi:TIGR00159 family protein [Dissulfurirhabdus thermomarina]|uniref:Diadenylate cyclase n=1 Tax=Dissulfurirhabdus thermomarina TaxID=1765737 RepID=A0A6N9TQW6_DISTH|nr:diadenylate cyclase CdaA [Dissulfurirhabdus thermomarina]NDY42840.1 TIGR00159 family protein [Dissulfurirhabdus thermomarina]NMX24237.1 TIGR00159 family protein [Dissulfurirhabdus thermomarina]